MRVAILGGGIGGLSLAWFLSGARGSQVPSAESREGPWQVDVYEQEAVPGGLVRSFEVEGHRFDQHYHCVLVGDRALRGLVEDLDLGALLRFGPSRMGFYDGQRCIPFDDPLDLLRFPLLSPLDKVRLVATILYCQWAGDVFTLHQTPLQDWLVQLGGKNAFERVWAPLLRSKFDGGFEGMPATYLWSRLRRMQGTRERGGAVEKLGILKGGTSSVVQALARKLPERQVRIRCGSRVVGLEAVGRQTRVRTPDSTDAYDLVISTLATPLHNRLAESAKALARSEMPDRYLGIVDVVVALRRSLTPYYTLNLLDGTLPFTGIIETTHLMDPADHAGVHLVYLPRYTDPSGPIYALDDETVRALFLDRLLRMFPALRPDDVLDSWVFREPYVEPIHLQGGAFERFPESLSTDRHGVYLMNTGRLYPALHNCQAVIALADRTARYLVERHA